MESGFRINKLILVESNFYRINNVYFGPDLKTELKVNVDVSVNEKTITVSETVLVVQEFQKMEQVKVNVRMIGVFECIGESQLKDFDEFGKINGAAIIFPYIREHITNLSLKSGIVPIILAPVNFAHRNKNKFN